MKNYNITVNGTSYEVSVEEAGAAAPVMPFAAATPASANSRSASASSRPKGRSASPCSCSSSFRSASSGCFWCPWVNFRHISNAWKDSGC